MSAQRFYGVVYPRFPFTVLSALGHDIVLLSEVQGHMVWFAQMFQMSQDGFVRGLQLPRASMFSGGIQTFCGLGRYWSCSTIVTLEEME